jgi:KDEL-tailed cysteine endopeptidase
MRMGRSALLVAALLAAVLPASALALANAVDFGEEDLASEETLWALHERWRGRHGVACDLGDKAFRFNMFHHNMRPPAL